MRRSASVCVVGFLFTVLTIATIISLMFYMTVFRKSLETGVVPEGDKRISPKADGKTDTKNDLTDHRSHSKPGNFYESVDYLGKGKVAIELDGTQSHTHYFDEGPPVSVGKLVSLVWFDNNTHEVLGIGTRPKINFTTGTTVVGLTVADNTRDTHTAFTVVTVKSSTFDGAYCYYYDGNVIWGLNMNIALGTKPFYASSVQRIEFDDAKDFPVPKSKRGSDLTIRCAMLANMTRNGIISVRHTGKLRVVANGTELNMQKINGVSSGTYPESLGRALLQLIFTHNTNSDAKFNILKGLDVLKYDVAKILPVVSDLDPQSSTFIGGGKMRIKGSGLNTDVTVYVDSKNVNIESIEDDGSSLTIIVPKAVKQSKVPVFVRNRNGDSQVKDFLYSKDGKIPIKFKEAQINWGAHKSAGEALVASAVTGIKYGPDHRFYMISLNGHVSSFSLDENLKLQGSICRSLSLGSHRKPLGMAFNYAASDNKVYVSTSIFKWKQRGLITGPLAWANGQIHVLKPNRGIPCLKETSESPIITGLPVSNHDHGVNGMVFDDDGHLRIQVGGFTNGGHNDPGSKLGGIDENPLSGASIIARVNDPNFDGHIKYAPANPSTAIKIGGSGVKIYMPGWRNSFGICVHSNGFVYATDNGPSAGFGDKSTTCNTHEPFKSERENLDKLGKVMFGKYGGHPNRNRARKDTQQCEFMTIGAKKKGKYLPPILKLESSTTGVLEYTANTFEGQMKNNLVLSMFKTDGGTGTLFRVRLDQKGDPMDSEPEKLAGRSGLAIEMTPHGALIMPQVYGGSFVAYVPDSFRKDKLIFTAVMPPRGSYKGGNKVIVTGRSFRGKPKALFNGKKCDNVTNITSTSFMCIVPKGRKGERVKVEIVIDDDIAEKHDGYDYKYTNT